MPYNGKKHNHWILFIVCYPGNIFLKESKDIFEQALILYMDSYITLTNKYEAFCIRKYLEFELQKQKSIRFNANR